MSYEGTQERHLAQRESTNGAAHGLRTVLGSELGDSISPSLNWLDGGKSAYEMKFLLPEGQAGEVEAWAREHMAFDPHADAALGNAYRIHSLYLDTPNLDILHRSNFYRGRKYRLRRYGTEHGVYLERKTRKGDRVSKRRTLIADSELHRLQEQEPSENWTGSWFHERILIRRLQPVCRVSTERVAHVGMSAEGPIRLTFDRQVRSALTQGYEVGEFPVGRPAFGGVTILELKFRATLPGLFRRLLAEMKLVPSPASKYRQSMQCWR